ncbi:MAG: DMT family transporter [Eubacteriales bacterium]
MKQNKALGYAAITLVAIIYGVSYMARNIITDTKAVDPTGITCLMLLIMAIAFAIYNISTKKSIIIEKKDVFIVLISGFIGAFLFQTLTNLSVSHVGAGIPSLVFGLATAFALIINAVVYKKKSNGLGWGAVALSMVGLCIVTGITPQTFADTNLLGYGMSIGAALAWVVYCFLADKISAKYEKTVLLFWNAVVGAVCSAPFLLIYPIDGVAFQANLWPILGALIVLGLFNATLGKFLNVYAIKIIGVNMSNIFLNFMPIATLLSVFLVYGTAPKVNEIIGGIIIIGSVLLLGVAENRKTSVK